VSRGREYEIAFRLGALVESSFRRSMGDAENQFEDMERIIRQLSRTNPFNGMDREARRAEQAVRQLEGSTGGFGDTLRRVAEYTGAFEIVQGVTDSFKNIVGTISDYDNAMAQIQASTGATVSEMKEIDVMAKELYSLPMGEGFEDLSEAISVTKQVTQQAGEELENTTRNAIVFRDVFKGDVNESVKTVDTMMKNFGITSEQSFNLLAQGAQKGLDKSGELLDSANEYAPQFAALGYSADEMFNIFNSGIKAGAFNLDKVGDAAKEFNLIIRDGSSSTSDALAELFAPDDITQWTDALAKSGKKSSYYMSLVKKSGKATADQLVKDLQKGGSAADKANLQLMSILGSGQTILDGLADKSIKGKDVMQDVIQKLSQIEDPLKRNQLGVALFGTQFEDLQADVIAAMGTTRGEFDMTKKTMEEVAAVKYDTIGKKFQSVGRQLMTELVIPIAEDLMPALQSIAEWMTKHDDLVKGLALGVPAALIGKNVIKLVKGIGAVEGAATGAGAAVGRFGAVLPMLTNPVGLAVTGVAALTLGVIAYKDHQEAARQELIHMGEALQEASKSYQSLADANTKTHSLIAEYEQLSQTIETNTDKSRDLTTEKQRLADITSQLQELYPDTISQYDIENGKIKEKLGLLGQEADAEMELARLKLEKEVADKERDLPDLEKVIHKIEQQAAAVQSQRNALDSAIPSLKNYSAEFQRLMEEEPSDKRTEQLEALRQKVNEVSSTVGYQFQANLQLIGLDDAIDDLTNQRVAAIQKQIDKASELQVSHSSYQELYEAQKNLIELNLGGKLEEQAEKFNTLSYEEKIRFSDALSAINELNNQMDLLPVEKKINVDVLYRTSGMEQPAGTGSKPLFDPLPIMHSPPKISSSLPQLPKFADGGISDRPSIFGEAGPEIAIPLDSRPRSRSLLDAANRLMGNDSDGIKVDVNWAPQLVVQGDASPSVLSEVKAMLQTERANFMRQLQDVIKQQRRVSMNQ